MDGGHARTSPPLQMLRARRCTRHRVSAAATLTLHVAVPLLPCSAPRSTHSRLEKCHLTAALPSLSHARNRNVLRGSLVLL